MQNNKYKKITQDDFNSIAITIASSQQIENWSRGEVKKAETINYRTQKPERDGLFCEKIFGPVKNWECSCGKYKRIRYKGVVCERCGVEITRSIVRRERMAHINLAVPIAHVWYLRSTPSRIGLLLNLPVKILEQIVYFSSYIVTEANEETKKEALINLDKDFENYKKKLKEEFSVETSELKSKIKSGEVKENELEKLQNKQADFIQEIEDKNSETKKALEGLCQGSVLAEIEWRDMSMKFGHVFSAGTGAESIRKILEKIDLDAFAITLHEEIKKSSGQKQKKILKRIRLVESLNNAGIRPEWMILLKLPILPPDIRPMVQLDGGRFATSDLNDLYRRVINRNNRLKRLLSIGAPEVICRNEKRMLQEAVDTLLNNSPRTGKAVFTTGERRKLRSLSDMLKGKQGRFRQNLLGKRVDYSGRSVIVVGPELKLNEMGMPKEMALKLFKPFVIGRLLQDEHAYNIKGAERLILNNTKVVWDILQEVIEDKYALLNRAPTLHRLGIQAFKPLLIEGKAIQLHPLVCVAFNADFDGDQMAVHIPLTDEAQKEAREILNAATNILKPASGQPIITPTQDMVLGIYYLTQEVKGKKGEGKYFKDTGETILAYRQGVIDLQAKIKARVKTKDGVIELIDTTAGRVIFNSVLPVESIGYKNYIIKKGLMSTLINEIFNECGEEATAKAADEIKRIGFKFATKSGISISINDLLVPETKAKKIHEAETFISQIEEKFQIGLMTDQERYNLVIRTWSKTKNDISADMVKLFDKNIENHIYYMIDSGARGNWGQVTQLCGMKGLVTSPSGRTIELPIISNFKEGFSILEFFNATHGGRKGKSDTALKTAEAGYLTRRLVDAVQDVVVKEEDCLATTGININRAESEVIGEKFENRIYGRTLLEDVKNKKGEVIGKAGEIINHIIVQSISDDEVPEVFVRSIITCKVGTGVCRQCYGFDLSNNCKAEIGTPVGIIAAQAIGEPGTQLTMRTFHTGGVASEGGDITQGLTRVEELFEARPPKTPAILSEIGGKVSVQNDIECKNVYIEEQDFGIDEYFIQDNYEIIVKKGELIKAKQILGRSKFNKNTIKAKLDGIVENIKHGIVSIKHDKREIRTYSFKTGELLKIDHGEIIQKGTPLNSGHYDLREIMEITDVYSTQKYVIKEVQSIYAQQGQVINDKHIEIIAKQMFSKIRIVEPGDSVMLHGEVTDLVKFNTLNQKLVESGKKPALGERLLLGLTRLALATDSWLSAASFQETIRVLVEASATRKIDYLEGLKENVIIGKLIPVGKLYKREGEG